MSESDAKATRAAADAGRKWLKARHDLARAEQRLALALKRLERSAPKVKDDAILADVGWSAAATRKSRVP